MVVSLSVCLVAVWFGFWAFLGIALRLLTVWFSIGFVVGFVFDVLGTDGCVALVILCLLGFGLLLSLVLLVPQLLVHFR